jgi:hypothetical protein
MKQALDDAPWETIEAAVQISRTRRHELIRLLAFSEAQQRQVALLRLQETQARPLHSALRAGELSPAQVDQILERLQAIAVERATASSAAAPDGSGVLARRPAIDGPTVARLVARAKRQANEVVQERRPRWLPPLREQLERSSRAVQRAQERVDDLGTLEVEQLLREVAQLERDLAAVTTRLRARQQEQSDPPPAEDAPQVA